MNNRAAAAGGEAARKRICAEFSIDKNIANLRRIIKAATHQASNSPGDDG